MSTYLLRAKRIYTFIFRVWFVDVFSSALGVSLPISIAIQESRLESIATYYETSSTRDGYVPRSQIIPWWERRISPSSGRGEHGVYGGKNVALKAVLASRLLMREELARNETIVR